MSESKGLKKAILKIGGPQKAAIVLKAAGKIEKIKDKNTISGVNPYPVIRSFECAWSGDDYRSTCNYMDACADVVQCKRFKKQIRTLLQSLPESKKLIDKEK